MDDNKNFTLTFGQSPQSFIERTLSSKQILDDFNLDFPLSHIYIICGVRGSGKTVLMTNISKMLEKDKSWVVVDINPNREILEQVAAGLYENKSTKHLFLTSSFSFSFKGFGFQISGKEPISNIMTLLEKMLDTLKKHNKKLLITIDEVLNNSNMRSFVHDFQSLLRKDYPVFSLMTGLYENVNSLQNNKNLTFLYRAPKVNLDALDEKSIEGEYGKIFANSPKSEIEVLSHLTKGYAFSYQVAGFLYGKYGDVEKIIPEFDKYLSVYVYEKIWYALPEREQQFLKYFDTDKIKADLIIKKGDFSQKEYSVYRRRLIDRGLLKSSKYGELELVLPRFEVFIKRQDD